MIKVAICDDDTIIREALKKYLDEYAKMFEIYEYENGTTLLEDEKTYDLVFLDYEFKNDEGNTGLMIAQKLRDQQKNVKIIFVSGYSDVVYDSFEVGTFRFLLKPIDTGKLKKALDDYVQSIKTNERLDVKTKAGNRILYTNEIVYIESKRRYCTIYLASGESVECRESVAELEERLSKELFGKCHKSYLIGFSYVHTYNRSKVKLSLGTGIDIDIGRTKYQTFIEAYMEYVDKYC